MAVLTREQIARAGLEPAALAAAAAGGDSFPNDGRTFVRVANAHAANARTVTFNSEALGLGQGAAQADLAVVVPALEERWIGPFDPTRWNDENGRVAMSYSDAAANVTVGVYRL